jgi:1,4-alpha-glucan branching enzyme
MVTLRSAPGLVEARARDGNRSLTYRELADQLVPYVRDMGFTHIEMLPVLEHPFSGSWGYQVTGFFAPTSRHGSPHDFKYFRGRVSSGRHRCRARLGAGPLPEGSRTAWRASTGTALYEHDDPRQGEHQDWGTLIFNYGRNEVRNFLLRARCSGSRSITSTVCAWMPWRRCCIWTTRGRGSGCPIASAARESRGVQFLQQLNTLTHGEAPARSRRPRNRRHGPA